MKAAFIQRTGGPEVIEFGELPKPVPGPGEVLVKVGASAVNPIDTYIRSGMVAMPLKYPFIPGCDLAGTVEAVGAGASRYRPGDRVWGSNQGLLGRQGTLAEYAAVHEQWLYPTPARETDAEAVAGALVGITAHLGLFQNAGLKAGEVVFVNGGTGGVGASVVQLAKAAGAKVIATVGNAAKKALCESFGADLALDYHASDLDEAIKKFSEPQGGIHVWFETQRQPTFDRTVSLMAPGGRIVLIAGRQARPEFPVGPFYVKSLRMFGFAMFNAPPEEQASCAAAINGYFERGSWQPRIGTTFPLSEAAAAHAAQEQNSLEKQGILSSKIVVLP